MDSAIEVLEALAARRSSSVWRDVAGRRREKTAAARIGLGLATPSMVRNRQKREKPGAPALFSFVEPLIAFKRGDQIVHNVECAPKFYDLLPHQLDRVDCVRIEVVRCPNRVLHF